MIATVTLLVVSLWLSSVAERHDDWAARAVALMVAATQVVVLVAAAFGHDPERYGAVLAPAEIVAAAVLLVGSLLSALHDARR